MSELEEALEAVSKITDFVYEETKLDMTYDAHHFNLTVVSTCYMFVVELNGVVIYSSEDDCREVDEDGYYTDSIEEFLLKEIGRHISIMRDVEYALNKY